MFLVLLHPTPAPSISPFLFSFHVADYNKEHENYHQHFILGRPGTGSARRASPALPTPGEAPAASATPRSAGLWVGRASAAHGAPLGQGWLRPPGRGQQVCERAGLPAPALAPYLQQLHVARREPAAEPVLLLAFPPAAVRDLQQRDELARGEAQPLAVPLPGEGVYSIPFCG